MRAPPLVTNVGQPPIPTGSRFCAMSNCLHHGMRRRLNAAALVSDGQVKRRLINKLAGSINAARHEKRLAVCVTLAAAVGGCVGL